MIIEILIFVFATATSVLLCQTNACEIITDHYHYDISALQEVNPFEATFAGPYGTFTYYVSFCNHPGMPQCRYCAHIWTHIGNGISCHSNGYVQHDCAIWQYTKSSHTCNTCIAQWPPADNGGSFTGTWTGDGVSFQLTGDSSSTGQTNDCPGGRQTTINLICQQDTDEPIFKDGNQPSGCSYVLEFYTKYACDNSAAPTSPTISPSIHPTDNPSIEPTPSPSINKKLLKIKLDSEFYWSILPGFIMFALVICLYFVMKQTGINSERKNIFCCGLTVFVVECFHVAFVVQKEKKWFDLCVIFDGMMSILFVILIAWLSNTKNLDSEIIKKLFVIFICLLTFVNLVIIFVRNEYKPDDDDKEETLTYNDITLMIYTTHFAIHIGTKIKNKGKESLNCHWRSISPVLMAIISVYFLCVAKIITQTEDDILTFNTLANLLLAIASIFIMYFDVIDEKFEKNTMVNMSWKFIYCLFAVFVIFVCASLVLKDIMLTHNLIGISNQGYEIVELVIGAILLVINLILEMHGSRSTENQDTSLQVNSNTSPRVDNNHAGERQSEKNSLLSDETKSQRDHGSYGSGDTS